MATKIIIENVNSYIEGDHDRLLGKFTTYAPGFKYTKLFQRKLWDGKVCLVKDSSFPTGLLHAACETLKRVEIEDRRSIKKISLEPTSIKLRDYQQEVVNKCFTNRFQNLWWPRGVIHAATGSGKTVIAAAMIEMTQVPTIFLVHRRELVEQTIRVFEKYSLNPGGIADLGKKNLIVCTIQGLMSWSFKRKKPSKNMAEKKQEVLEYLDKVEQVYLDEAHLCASSLEKGNLFIKALSLMPNAYMRWGLTATPFMREEYHNWLLEGSTGPTIMKVTTQQLIKAGYLSCPKIHMIRTPRMKIPREWPTCYELGIVMNDWRNSRIVELIEEEDAPIMVLVTRLDHGEILIRKCQEAGLPVKFLSGACSLDERKAALEAMLAGQLKAVIGTKIWDSGLDVSEIQTLILGGGGRSKLTSIQRLGRGLRRTSKKSEVRVFDFVDNASGILIRHSQERQRTWDSEGHEVIIK